MPGGDGTGPRGQGPMTGRGAGICSGSGVPGFMNRCFGFARGMARRMGRGWGRGGGRGMGNGRGRGFGPPAKGWMGSAGANAGPAPDPESEK